MLRNENRAARCAQSSGERELNTQLVPTCRRGDTIFCEEAWAGVGRMLRLSRRQLSISRLALSDVSDVDIASERQITTGTVRTHTERLYKKLYVHSRLQLAACLFAAYRRWLINSPPSTGCPLRSRLELHSGESQYSHVC